ncbi:hypothetical protein HGB07_05380 [Candidatus Roizmanbacteria bacterium]|nr:hypothetical protein [Candidatus Roizmanbacteria bacterium]
MWPEVIAPYQVHLVGLDLKDDEIKQKAEALYQRLSEKGVEILFDDRIQTSAGEKFADADLIGIPHRITISKRTGDKIEYKKRTETESKLISEEELMEAISKE